MRIGTIATKALYSAVLFFSFASCSRSPGYSRDQVKSGRGQTEGERNKVMNAVEKFAPLKKRAVVLALWNDTPVKGKFEVQAKNYLREALLDSDKLNLVDDKEIPLRSQDFYLDSDKLDVAHVSENGKKWGVSLVILGRISKIAFRRQDDDVGLLRPTEAKAAVSVELRLIDVAQAKEIALGEGAGLSENSTMNLFGQDPQDAESYRNDVVAEALGEAVHKAIPSLLKEVDRIQWRGKIIKVAGAKLYVNAGRATGLQVGDILKVSSQGTDIFDPDSGLFLGRTAGDLKGTLEVMEFFGEDGAITRVHSGANFQEGDTIQLY